MKFFDRFKKSRSKFECDQTKDMNIQKSLTGNNNNCRNKGEYLDYVCIHPPSTKYNQYDGEYGYYLGPDESLREIRRYNSKDDIKRLEEYFFCYPSYEDENHFVVRSCEEHHKNPTMLTFDIQSLIEREKEKRFEELGI